MAKLRRKKRKGSRKVAKAAPVRAVEAALAGIAHDIRTPLTGIVALAELLAASNLSLRQREWAAAIKSGAETIKPMKAEIDKWEKQSKDDPAIKAWFEANYMS